METVRTKVKFYCGTKHPFADVELDANVTVCCGYNGRCCLAKTVDKVHYPERPQGLLVFDKDDKFIGYKPAPAYDDYIDTYVDCILDPETGEWTNAFELSEKYEYRRLKAKYEKNN